MYRSKDEANFEAWLCRDMGAGHTCLGCKLILKGTCRWDSPDNSHACKLCVEKQRPCIQVTNVGDANGEVVGHSLHVLPVAGEDGFGDWVAP